MLFFVVKEEAHLGKSGIICSVDVHCTGLSQVALAQWIYKISGSLSRSSCPNSYHYKTLLSLVESANLNLVNILSIIPTYGHLFQNFPPESDCKSIIKHYNRMLTQD